jgi:hypothetical protein
MSKNSQFLLFVLTIATLVLSACGAAIATSTPNTGGGKVEPLSVAFIGLVDSIAGDQWVINGQTVTVAPDAIQDGPFGVGDQVKVEGVVNSDGSFTVASVENPTLQDVSSLPSFGDDNSNAGVSNENEANENSANENEGNENESNENESNENEGNENESNENEGNENENNENESNENESNENSSNENESNENDGGNENEGNENDGGENEENENESNGNDD